jgi:hypothetical protein
MKTIRNECSFKVYVSKPKVTLYKGKYQLRSKIVLDNRKLEKLSRFNYFGFDIIYHYVEDISRKVNMFPDTLGTLSRTQRKC